MLRMACEVWSAMSSLTSRPVFGSNPPWPDRKIQSPTASPGEYGPADAGAAAESTSSFIREGSSRAIRATDQVHNNIAKFLCIEGAACLSPLTPSINTRHNCVEDPGSVEVLVAQVDYR